MELLWSMIKSFISLMNEWSSEIYLHCFPFVLLINKQKLSTKIYFGIGLKSQSQVHHYIKITARKTEIII